MRKLPIYATLLLLVAVQVQGDAVEDNTNGVVTYQFDDGTYSDAPDTCPEWVAEHGPSPDYFLYPGETLTGIVVPLLDPADFYGIVIGAGDVGTTFRVTYLISDLLLAGYPVDITLRGLTCNSSIPYTVISNGLVPGNPKQITGDYIIEFTPTVAGTYLSGIKVHTPHDTGLARHDLPPVLGIPLIPDLPIPDKLTDLIFFADILLHCVVEDLLDCNVECFIDPEECEFSSDSAPQSLPVQKAPAVEIPSRGVGPLQPEAPMEPTVCHQCAPQLAGAASSFSYRGSVTSVS